MAVSTVQQGAYYVQRTAQLLTRQGYVVLALETKGWRRTKGGWFPFTRDTGGADLVARSAEKTLWVQVKSWTQHRPNLAEARRLFARYPLSPSAEHVLYLWAAGAREPEVEIVAVGPKPADGIMIAPPRRRPRVLPLFRRVHA